MQVVSWQALFFGFLPAGLRGLLCTTLAFGGGHSLQAALPADLTPSAAHLGHHLRENARLNGFFGSYRLKYAKGDLVGVRGTLANTLGHTV